MSRTCLVCGKGIPKGSGRSLYCSDECAKAADNKRRRKVPTMRICRVCGKEYEFLGKNKSLLCFCSKECQAEGKRQDQRAFQKRLYGAMKPRHCRQCGELFLPLKTEDHFCSKKCLDEYNASRYERKSDNRLNIQYMEDLAKHSEKFNKLLAELAERGESYAEYQKRKYIESTRVEVPKEFTHGV